LYNNISMATPVASANNYSPVLDANNRPICSMSTVKSSDLNYSLLAPNGNFNLDPVSMPPVSTNNKTQVPICTDDEIYRIQEVVLKKLNAFNLEYSNYQIYLFNKQHSLPGDQTPQMNYIAANGGATIPSSSSAQNTMFQTIPSAKQLPSYIDLNQSLTTYNNLLYAKNIYASDPADPSLKQQPDYYTPSGQVNPKYANNPQSQLSNRDPSSVLVPKHAQIQKMRQELDTKLMELNDIQNSVFGSSKLQTDASIYVTILWTTLATAMIYYTFVHM